VRAITTPSRLGFKDTVESLQAKLAATGQTLFAAIDQAAAARGVGLELRPTTLLVFGNPKGGTPLMAAYHEVALCLPLKLVVAELATGHVSVMRERMTVLAADYGVPADHPALAAMDQLLEALAASVA
jgi:uncharacterized protein (DUF302 family)